MTIAVTLNPSIAEKLAASGDHVIVTGATGWLGQNLLEALSIAIPHERIHAYASTARSLPLNNGVTLEVQALETLAQLPDSATYLVFHFAFLTKDKQGLMSLEEYADTNRGMRATLVESALSRLKVRCLCVTSSGAVYGKDGELNRDLEAYPYAALKVEEEEFFTDYAHNHNIPLIIPRIFNMSGPYINKWTAYALSNLLVMAMKNEPLVIKAKHPVVRAYAYAGDIINVLLGWMLAEGATQLLFDVGVDEQVEIGELAKRICAITGRDESAIEREFDDTLSADNYVGKSRSYLSLCAEFGIEPLTLDAQIRLTMEDIEARLT